MKIAAVILDLDGTLIDSLEDIAHAANRVLARLGMPGHEVAAYRGFVGDGVRTLMHRVLPPGRDDRQTVDRCVALFRELYAASWDQRTRPYAGIVEMLARLRSESRQLAVLSNKPHELTCGCVERFFPDAPFTIVLGQRDTVARKPDPAGALEIARRLDLPSQRMALVGDSAIDIQTAASAGMTGIGAAWGFRARDELQAAGADAVIDHPAQLFDVLGDARRA